MLSEEILAKERGMLEEALHECAEVIQRDQATGTSSTSAADDVAIRASEAIRHLASLPAHLEEQLRIVEERDRRKISLQGFNEGELAVFFPIPQATKDSPKEWLAFNVDDGHHYLAEESKQIIEANQGGKYMNRHYVLGQIVHKEKKASDGSNHLAAGTEFFSVIVQPLDWVSS